MTTPQPGFTGTNEERISTPPQRVLGMDLLRVVAMLMVVILHVLFHGGVVNATPRTSVRGMLLWLFWAENYCAVDLFVLASGWLLATKRFRPARILTLCIQVYFTSIAIRIVAGLCCSVPLRWNSFLSDYWFWNSYLILVLLSPIVNAGLQALLTQWSRGRLWTLLAVLTFLMSGLPIRGIDNGYGPLWLLIPYAVGAAIRMTSTGELSSRARKTLPWMALSLPVAGVAVRFLCWKAGLETPFFLHPYRYHSPLVLATGVCWLLFFSNLHIQSIPGILRLAAATSFGVYLIHDNPIIRGTIVQNRFAGLGDKPLPVLFAGLIVSTIGIYAACMVLDGIRLRLFRWLRISDRCQSVAGRFQSR